MKVTQEKFFSVLKSNGINPIGNKKFWQKQLEMWNAGIRDVRMHDNALVVLGLIENQS